MPVTAHYSFILFRLSIYLSMSNILIALSLSHHLEGAQLDTGSNSCTIFSFNTFMYEDNYQ